MAWSVSDRRAPHNRLNKSDILPCMSQSHAVLRILRLLHLYIGIFIAPMLLFFALTGALQTFNLHETTPGSNYKPPALFVSLAQIHKKQTYLIPQRKSRPSEAKPGDAKTADAKPDAAKGDKPAAPAPEPPQKSHLPLKIFFLLVSLGLFVSTMTGIYMAYKFIRSRLLVTGLLIAGVVVPIFLVNF